MQRNSLYAIIVFVGLATAAGVLIIMAQGMADAYARAVLIQMGGMLLGAGLTVLLVRLLGATNSNGKEA